MTANNELSRKEFAHPEGVARAHLNAQLTVDIRGKTFGNGHAVLAEVRFKVAPGEIVALVGPSGCGKTTTLRLIAGLDTDYEGTVFVGETRVTAPGPDRGIVFQESRLFPWMNAEKNVAFALPSEVPPGERQRRVADALELVGLVGAAQVHPYQLSGGMEKRVALARALVNLPTVLLLDEPLAAVDPLVRFSLQDQLIKIHAREKLTTLLVTHDIDEAVQLSDRIIILTGRPTTVGIEVKVSLPHPRSRASIASAELRGLVLKHLLDFSKQGNVPVTDLSSPGPQ